MIPRLHLVTDDRVLSSEGVRSAALSAMEAGGTEVALHVRGPRTSGAHLFDLARTLKESAERTGCLLLVNDRVDLALALGLDGVHLGQRSLPPRAAREVLGSEPLVGLSVHGVEEALGVSPEMVDYLFVGTIFESPSHPGAPGAGPGRLAEVGGVTTLPLLAIGGVTPERVEEVVRTGASGVAVVSGIWDASDPGDAVGVYLEALSAASRARGSGERPHPGF